MSATTTERSARARVALGLAVALAASALAAACGGHGAGEAAAPDVSVDGAQAHALVAQGATLLDVRTREEWDAGHVEGAVLIPVQELEGRLSEVSRDKPVVVYCASGVRAAHAVAMLRAAGYDARDLGRMSRWDG